MPRQSAQQIQTALGSWAGSFLACSLCLVGALAFVLPTVSSPGAKAAVLLVISVYAAVVYGLHNVSRLPVRASLVFWLASLAAHVVLFGLALWLVDTPLILLLLMPEVLGGLLHLPGVYFAALVIRGA